VYTSEDRIHWQFDPRLHPATIKLCAGKLGGSAIVDVALDPEFDTAAALAKYTGLNQYILIDTGEENSDLITNLFTGRIVRPVLTIGGEGKNYQEGVALDCEHICNDLRNVWINGRVIVRAPNLAKSLEGESEETIAAQMASNYLVISKPAIANYRGKGNMSKTTFRRETVDGVIDCPVFSGQEDGFDPNALPFTYRHLFRYLVGWYAGSDKKEFDFTIIDFSDFVKLLMGVTKDEKIDYYLDQPAVEISLQGHMLDVLDKVAKAAGIKYGYPASYSNSSRPEVAFSFRAWAPGTGTVRYFRLEKPQRNIVGNGWPKETNDELLERNNIDDIYLGIDSSQIVTYVNVSGSPVRVEFTAELVPGWPVDTVLDNPADVKTAKSAAAKHWLMDPSDLTSDVWYRTYHADSGAAGEKLNYGRLWVLNEDEGFEPNTDFPFPYNRAVFSLVEKLNLTGEFTGNDYPAIDWKKATATRPRKFWPCLTCEASGKSQGVVTEISFDGGGTWHAMNSGVRNLENRCGVYLAVGDLSTLMPSGVDDPVIANAWWAMLDKKFRVRVTACVELDVEINAQQSIGATVPYCLVHEDKHLRLWKRLKSSKYTGDAYKKLPVQEYDDRKKAIDLASTILKAKAQYQLPGRFVLPWLETEYDIGDVVEKIDGREIPLAMSVGTYTAMPEVYQIIWRADKSWSTEICLSDHRMASETI
jgi:hypothetical protein